MIDKIFLKAKIRIIGDEAVAYHFLGIAKTCLAKTIELREFKKTSVLSQRYRTKEGITIRVKTVMNVADYITITIPPRIKVTTKLSNIKSSEFSGLFFICGNPHDYEIKTAEGELSGILKLNYTKEYKRYQLIKEEEKEGGGKPIECKKTTRPIQSPIEFPPISDVFQGVDYDGPKGVDRFSDSFSKTWSDLTVTAYEVEVSAMLIYWRLAASFNNKQVIINSPTFSRGNRIGKSHYIFDIWADNDKDYFLCYPGDGGIVILKYNRSNNTMEPYKSIKVNPVDQLTKEEIIAAQESSLMGDVEIVMCGCGIKRNNATFNLGNYSKNGITIGYYMPKRPTYFEANISLEDDATASISKLEKKGGIKSGIWNHIENKMYLIWQKAGEAIDPGEPSINVHYLSRHRWTTGVWFTCNWDLGGVVIDASDGDWAFSGAIDGGCVGWCCGERCTCPGMIVSSYPCTYGSHDFTVLSYPYFLPGNNVDVFNWTKVIFETFIPGSAAEYGKMYIGEAEFDLGSFSSGAHSAHVYENCTPVPFGLLGENYRIGMYRSINSIKAVMGLTGFHWLAQSTVTNINESTKVSSAVVGGERVPALSTQSNSVSEEELSSGNSNLVSDYPYDQNLRALLLRYKNINNPIIVYSDNEKGNLFFDTNEEVTYDIEMLQVYKRACFIGVN